MKNLLRTLFVAFTVLLNLSYAEYKSQCGQDKFVNETLFKNFRGGFFVDVGAHNGIRLSNTYFFEKELGWKGICLEPIPEVFKELEQNRECICICGCASVEHNVTKDFLRISGRLEMLSGLVGQYDPEHKERIDRQLGEYGGSKEIIQVQCFNLNRLFEEMGIEHIHFLSLDTEGGEFQILKNLDFSKVQIDVIAVEDNYKNHKFASFLKTKGFRLIKVLEQDLIFIHKNFRA